MTRTSLLVLALSSALVSVSAFDISGRIQWNDVSPGINTLGHAKVALDNGRLSAGITRDGNFLIPNVPVGTYVMSVISRDHTFDQLRIDVLNTSADIPEVRPFVAGTPLNPPSTILLQYPITLTPRQKHVYFSPPESFNLVAMFSNPMMLLMVFGGVMMLAMPYLINNMDPESLEEFKGQQAKITGIQNAVASGDLKSGLSALMAGDESPTPTPPPTPKAPIPAKKGVKNKRR